MPELACKFRNMALQHRRAGAIQLLLERFDDVGMIVAGVVNTVSRQEIKVAGSIVGKHLSALTALVAHVHGEQIEQTDPLRAHTLGIRCLCCQ